MVSSTFFSGTPACTPQKPPSLREVMAQLTWTTRGVFAYAEPRIEGVQSDGFVAGDDEQAKAIVLELVRSIGFNPIDAGALEVARALEARALVNILLQLHNNGSWQTAWKLVGPLSA